MLPLSIKSTVLSEALQGGARKSDASVGVANLSYGDIPPHPLHAAAQ
jgi:hypothetical protein